MKRNPIAKLGMLALLMTISGPVAAQVLSRQTAVHVEMLPVASLSLSSEQFLKGDTSGKPVMLAGVLRSAQGPAKQPVVVFLAPSSGFAANLDIWDRQFLEMGISTFALDSLSGRGIATTRQDQSILGRLNMIADLYRSLAVLATNPRVDPNRIAVMGFSLGAEAALYSNVKRFQRMWNQSGIASAATIALYAPCNTAFVDDADVSDRPIRLFHGVSDDYVQMGPCQNYVERLRKSGKDVKLIELADTWHGFDVPQLPPIPVSIPNTSANHCALREEPLGTIINVATRRPPSDQDACVTHNPHVAYSAASTHVTEIAVKDLLKTVFHLN
jgi:dienelactone hydrolase